MKIETQHTDELKHVAELIEDARVSMMTTLDSERRLASRPMAPLLMDEAGAIWFYTDAYSGKTAALDAVNLAFSDEGNATYVSLSGHGELVHDRERIKALWTSFAKPWFPNGPETPNLALLKFVPHTAEYWDAPDSRMVRLLAMAASAIAGKPVGMGEHDKLGDLSPAAAPPHRAS